MYFSFNNHLFLFIFTAMYNTFSSNVTNMNELESAIDNVILRKCQSEKIGFKLDESTWKRVESQLNNLKFKK